MVNNPRSRITSAWLQHTTRYPDDPAVDLALVPFFIFYPNHHCDGMPPPSRLFSNCPIAEVPFIKFIIVFIGFPGIVAAQDPIPNREVHPHVHPKLPQPISEFTGSNPPPSPECQNHTHGIHEIDQVLRQFYEVDVELRFE